MGRKIDHENLIARQRGAKAARDAKYAHANRLEVQATCIIEQAGGLIEPPVPKRARRSKKSANPSAPLQQDDIDLVGGLSKSDAVRLEALLDEWGTED